MHEGWPRARLSLGVPRFFFNISYTAAASLMVHVKTKHQGILGWPGSRDRRSCTTGDYVGLHSPLPHVWAMGSPGIFGESAPTWPGSGQPQLVIRSIFRSCICTCTGLMLMPMSISPSSVGESSSANQLARHPSCLPKDRLLWGGVGGHCGWPGEGELLY